MLALAGCASDKVDHSVGQSSTSSESPVVSTIEPVSDAGDLQANVTDEAPPVSEPITESASTTEALVAQSPSQKPTEPPTSEADTLVETENSISISEDKPASNHPPAEDESIAEKTEKELTLSVNHTKINVTWEENESVEALRELLRDGNITISMEQYGDFEQVGQLPDSLPRNDTQMTAQPGDIVLYAGNQLVLFYGSNSWAYTRLGHIKGLTVEEMTSVLGKSSISVLLSLN
jgi:hypothetical protein